MHPRLPFLIMDDYIPLIDLTERANGSAEEDAREGSPTAQATQSPSLVVNLEQHQPQGQHLEATSVDRANASPPTLNCLKEERREAEAQRARALLEREDLDMEEARYRAKKIELEKMEARLAEWGIKLDFAREKVEATLQAIADMEVLGSDILGSSFSD